MRHGARFLGSIAFDAFRAAEASQQSGAYLFAPEHG